MNFRSTIVLSCLIVAACVLASPRLAFGIPQDFDMFGGAGEADGEPLAVSAWFKIKEGTKLGNVYVQAKMGPTYHTYSQNHGGVETKTDLKVPASDQYKITGAFEPDHPPHMLQKNGAFYEEFEGQVTWSAPFELIGDVEPDGLELVVNYQGQVCDANSCLPPMSEALEAEFQGSDPDLEVRSNGDVPTQQAEPEEPEANTDEAAPAHIETADELAALAEFYEPDTKIFYEKLDGSSGTGTFWAAIFGAFVGGMLLNLMPCVFPVLGLKVLGFVEQAGNDPKKIKLHGIAFAMGLIVSMWVLAGAILAIKEFAGQEVSWGQQMGNPYFVGGIVILLFMLGLNLAGVFEMGLFMTGVGGGDKKEGYMGSFVSGIITTLVATPCSGPFLGAAMGYTLAQPPLIAMFLFTIFGLGIAVPYLILSFMPSLLNFLPPPGGWMETFKKLMAFTLFAAAAFFAKSFGSQTGVDGLSWFLMAICVLSLAAFFYGKFSPPYVNSRTRYVWGWAVPVLIAAGGVWMYLDAAKIEAPQVVAEDHLWELWVPGRVEQKLAMGKPIWVDYTADW